MSSPIATVTWSFPTALPLLRRHTMGAMDARRLELYDLLKPKLDEEPARQLVLALPAEPENLVTKDDLKSAFGSFGRQMDVRFAAIDVRFAHLETVLTRRMVAIMGAWTGVVSIAWATALAVRALCVNEAIG